jgi:hypothetical protein
MDSPKRSVSPLVGKIITIVIWGVGLALLLARKWLCATFHLNTEMYMASIMGPAWAFMLVCFLAGFLRVFRRPAEKWSRRGRVIFALAATFVLALPQIDLLLTLRDGWSFIHIVNRYWLIIPCVTALVFFLLPAGIVVVSWLDHNRSISTLRALGLALVIYAVLYVPFGLWINTLIVTTPAW